MRRLTYSTILALLALFVAPALAIEPISGSITYGGQPNTRLQKSPIGSLLTHDFNSDGSRYSETYILQPDRTLRLVDRVRQPNR